MSDNAPDLSIVGDRLTLHPPGVIQDQETPLLTPLDFLREVSLHLSGTGWRSYDDFIGRNIFYNGFSSHITALVLKNPRLQAKISELAHKRLDVEIAEGTLPNHKVEDRRKELEAQLVQVADSWTDQMICKMDSRRFIRGAYYFATQLLTRAYHQGNNIMLQ
ncbi:acyltransferase [Aureobasidium pullulans]|uniref:Acyltransferase n=1 Tax=Aureobasidium pullulans TaxID=5580 RepID=A0AB38LPG0_AURPU|nr:acyltransferase [Aureobasidium pullulans]THZ42780.1 acyltransferase [Aureobasidium pullulans]TIA31803.1 acyltransferase [Aureobasidium pullulans]